MKAMTVILGERGPAEITEVPEPPPEDGAVLVAGRSVGICGTGWEILLGYGEPPAGRRRLVLGHESLGQAVEASAGSGSTPAAWSSGSSGGPARGRCAPVPEGRHETAHSRMVLDNVVIFGTVNASRKNYQQAVDALTKADAMAGPAYHPPGSPVILA